MTNPDTSNRFTNLSSTNTAPQSRRRFLGVLSSFTAASALGTVSLSSLLNNQHTTVRAEIQADIGPLNPFQRRRRAQQLRQQSATFQANNGTQEHPNNGDDEFYANRIGSFTKALPHNALGEVDRDAYRTLVRALSSGDPNDYERIRLGGSAKLADPQAALAFDLEGLDPQALAMPPAPRLESEIEGAEMAEVYWRALTRDVPFSQYDSNTLTMSAVTDLKQFSIFSGLTTASLFRGNTPGDLAGPLISQFLWQNIPYGATTIRQQYRTTVAGNDHMTSYASWLSIQNGNPPAMPATFDTSARYIRNGRDLTEYVHVDFTYQAFLNAALILLSYGGGALDDANPYKTSNTQGGFITFGGGHVLDMVARVANLALKCAWYQKWQVHRRLRPEAYGGLVHLTKTGMAGYPIDAKLQNSSALGATMAKYGTFLLPMAYPEGCPTHPAYPAGHATISGACATVLKAFFKESFAVPSPVVASDDGATLNPSTASLTVGGELNKLAANISFGRDTAGVHWRSDGIEGMKLGEALAISVLQDFNSCFNEKFDGFSLTKFDGTTIEIDQRPGRSGRFDR
jgi:hypothetical protein